MKALHWLIPEVKAVTSVTLYFAVCSVVILLLKQLWLADYGIRFRGVATALLPVKVAPLPTNADVSLIDTPGPAARPEMPAYSLLEFGGKALHPAVQAIVEVLTYPKIAHLAASRMGNVA